MPRAFALAAALAASACATGDDSLLVGVGAGPVLAYGTTDRASPVDDPVLESDASVGGFVELMAPGETGLHVRLLASRHETDVRDATTTAELQQYLTTAMLSRAFEPVDGVVVRPMIGLGFGYVDVDFASPFGRDEQGIAGVVSGGLELEFARHALLGVQAWAGIFGEPGDTEGDFQGALFYAGVRF